MTPSRPVSPISATRRNVSPGLKATRDQAQADTMRAQATLDRAVQQPITTIVLRKFAATARKRMRIEGGGYRRDHLRALAQRVEVADHEVRIMGSKSDLLKTLAAISGAKSATGGVRSSVLDWRRERNWGRTASTYLTVVQREWAAPWGV
jgi:site-specific DNA recombinase